MNTYIELIDKYKGSNNIFILGAGPSLYHCMIRDDFKSILSRGVVIVVNSAILAYEEPYCFITNDHLVINWSWWETVLKSSCKKIVRNSWLKYKDYTKDGFYIFSPRKTSEGIIDFEDHGLSYCCSTCSAIDFGTKLVGEKGKIFVLGLDHKGSNGVNHFWHLFDKKDRPRQIRPAQGPWNQQSSLFPIYLKAYNALEEFSDYKNCKIYNCNLDSNVNSFEKIKFEKIIKIIKN